MRLLEHRWYLEDIEAAAGLPLPWEKMQGCSVTISGVTGMAGIFLSNVLMY